MNEYLTFGKITLVLIIILSIGSHIAYFIINGYLIYEISDPNIAEVIMAITSGVSLFILIVLLVIAIIEYWDTPILKKKRKY